MIESALLALGSTIFGGGVVWGSTRNRIATLKEDHSDLKKEVVAHKVVTNANQAAVIDRLARVETKIDLLLTKEIVR